MSENTASGYPHTDWPVGHYARDFIVGLVVSGALMLVGVKVLLTASMLIFMYHGDQGTGISGLTMVLLNVCNWIAWNGFSLALCTSLPLAALYSKWGPRPALRRRMVRIVFWSFLVLQIGLLIGVSLPLLTMEPG